MKHLLSMLALICVTLTAITFSITACSDEAPDLGRSTKIDLSSEVSIEMIKVEAGTFEMSVMNGIESGFGEVTHTATLTRDFYIGQTEVTQAQWQAVMGNNPARFSFKGDNLPVIQVSWNDAMEFCEKLNAMGKAPKGWMFTLPTETQWEYAARGGKKSKGYKYSGSNNIDEVAWYYGNSGNSRLDDSSWDLYKAENNNCRLHPVKQKKANELGLYDMSGNVYEWCLDDWLDKSDKLKAEFTRGNDRGESKRAMRGGAFCYLSDLSHPARRNIGYVSGIGDRGDHIGFRIALVQSNNDKTEDNKTHLKSSIKIDLSSGSSIEMVKVEAGTFEMSSKDGENERDEVPHQATLTRDFYIGQTEVTQSQWKAVMGTNPSRFKGDDLPVEQVSWNDAMEFCEKLNAMGKAPKGWMFTLPTETQWEYAARGGKKSKGYKYSGSNDVDEVAWHRGNSGSNTHPVGQKKANELGLYDMSGNVFELCLDDGNDDSSKQKAEFTRGNDQGGSKRVNRGGSWSAYAWFCRSSYRINYAPGFRDNFQLGFRLALVQSNNDKTEAKRNASKNDSTSESNFTSAEDQYLKGVVSYYEEDCSEAVKWFRKAAEQGHAKAQFELGRCYSLGEGVTENQVEAVKWFRKASEQGHVEAQGALGVLYYEGVGTTKNQVEGIKLLRKAAEGGSESARAFLRDHVY